jgi:Fe-S cluster biogenesis protein NfuA
MDNDLRDKVEEALETMRPFLAADGGDMELVNITDDMVVQLRLLGSCKNCNMSEMTLKSGIEDLEGVQNLVGLLTTIKVLPTTAITVAGHKRKYVRYIRKD